MVSLAVIGCGAVFEQLHALAIRRLISGREVELSALVDPDQARASRYAKRFPNAVWFPSLEEAAAKRSLQAVLIASPPALHRQQVETALGLGLHVLSEKPLVTTAADAHHLARVAAASGKYLAVGQTRRYFPSLAHAAQKIRAGELGPKLSFTYREGGIWGWPIASFAPFLRATAGGGVLTDKGVHILDLLLWLFGEMKVVSSADDSLRGGVEGNSEVVLEGPNVRGTVQVSWDQGMNNGLRITGEKGELRVQGDDFLSIELRSRGGNWTRIPNEVSWPASSALNSPPLMVPRDYQDCVYLEWVSFLRSVLHGEKVPVDASTAAIPIGQIEEAYRQAKPREEKWLTAREQESAAAGHWRNAAAANI